MLFKILQWLWLLTGLKSTVCHSLQGHTWSDTFPDLRLPVKPPSSSLGTVYPQQPFRVSEVLISSPSGICTLFSQLRMCFLLLPTEKFLSKIFISLNVTIRQWPPQDDIKSPLKLLPHVTLCFSFRTSHHWN